MKISWIKYKNDNNSFKIFKGLGLDVFDIENLEMTDKMIENLVNQKYKTIVISNEVASFSQDIIDKYNKDNNVKIIIAPSKGHKYDNQT